MADVLYLKDGSAEVIIGNRAEALRRILRERLGPDAEALFDDVTRELDVKAIRGMETGFEENAYRVAEYYDAHLRDALDLFGRIRCELEKPRLARATLKALATEGADNINRIL